MNAQAKQELSYAERVRLYEAEKRELLSKLLTPDEYEKAVKKLADKYEI